MYKSYAAKFFYALFNEFTKDIEAKKTDTTII